MVNALFLAAATFLPFAAGGADAGSATQPPTDAVPLPIAAPPAGRQRDTSDGAGHADGKGANAEKKRTPPTLALRDETRTIIPRRSGAALADGARITTKAGKDRFTATLIGGAYAHSSIHGRSDAAPVIRLVQVFDVVPGDRDGPRAKLSLSGKLDGYVRSETGGATCLRAAGATVYPLGGTEPVARLAFPTTCAPGAGAWRCEQTAEVPASIVPEGRYTLVVELAPWASAEGFCGGHAEAVFTPETRLGTWSYPPSPIANLDAKAFGLVVTLKVAAP